MENYSAAEIFSKAEFFLKHLFSGGLASLHFQEVKYTQQRPMAISQFRIIHMIESLQLFGGSHQHL